MFFQIISNKIKRKIKINTESKNLMQKTKN